jgi:hypothetical protein
MSDEPLDTLDPDVTAKRVAVWADPEREGPPLDRRDLVGGRIRLSFYGWTWWSARHIVLLPAGMTFYDALCSTEPLTVTITADVDPLASGLNETHTRYAADWCSHKPEDVVMSPDRLLEPVAEDQGDYFRLMRDIHRREHNLPRAVVRSDLYSEASGRQPHHTVSHDWPDGTFLQGGNASPADDGTYRVFIEAFPREPSTFIRGEGATFTDAEDALWAKWSRITGCPAAATGHDFEPRGYRNGAGICRHCSLFGSNVFDLAAIGSVCAICGVGTYWTTVPRRNPDGTWDRSNDDLLCEHHAFPAVHEVSAQVHAHQTDPTQPLPDLEWITPHLPAGVPVTEVPHRALYEAVKNAHRDQLDAILKSLADDEADR